MNYKNIIAGIMSVVTLASCSDLKLEEDFEEVFSNESRMVGFNFGDGNIGVIDQETNKISIVVPNTIDITGASPTVNISRQASVIPADGEAMDFTGLVNYEITSKSGDSTTIYEVSAVADIISFSIAGVDLHIDRTARTITGELPRGVDIANVTPVIGVHSSAEVSPASGVSVDLNSPVQYTISSKEGSASVTYSLFIAKTYYISTVEGLNNINNDLFGIYYLENDIDLNHQAFVPIGNESVPFSGSIDGQGHCIKNLTIDQAGQTNVGFFGVATGIIKNLNFESDGANHIDVVGFGPVATIVGLLQGGTVENCHAIGKVVSKGTGGSPDLSSYPASGIGALVGCNDGGTIRKCYSESTWISSNEPAENTFYGTGGLVGVSVGGIIEDCFVNYKTTLWGDTHYIGGLLGAAKNTTVRNCFAAISGEGQGGVGDWNNRYNATVPAGSTMGGIVGADLGGNTFSGLYYVSDFYNPPAESTDSGVGEGRTLVDMRSQGTYLDFDFDNVWLMPADATQFTQGLPQLRNNPIP